MKIIIVSPHLDDAAFSLSLAIGSWLHRNHRVEVINCFTQSEYMLHPEAESIPVNAGRAYVTALRLREDENWRKELGPGLQTRNLNLMDAPVRLSCGIDEVCSLAPHPEDNSRGMIRTAVEKGLARGEAALVLPLALGGHVDHRIAHDALLPLLDGSPNQQLAFYEDLPYAARVEGADKIERVVERMGGELWPAFASTMSEVQSAVQWKRRLAFCYESQIDDQTAGQIADFCRRYGGRERLWGNATWLASDLTIGDDRQSKAAEH